MFKYKKNEWTIKNRNFGFTIAYKDNDSENNYTEFYNFSSISTVLNVTVWNY